MEQKAGLKRVRRLAMHRYGEWKTRLPMKSLSTTVCAGCCCSRDKDPGKQGGDSVTCVKTHRGQEIATWI